MLPDGLNSPAPGIGLCLSGGGYRAAAFHLGALRRLNEAGVLTRLKVISSISGGSIISAFLARHIRSLRVEGSRYRDWEGQIERPFRQGVLSCDIRTVPALKQWVLPWNVFRDGPAVAALERQYHKYVTDAKLEELPSQPSFVFGATATTIRLP